MFESKFNKFAAFATGGEFCHTDIVLCVHTDTLKDAITSAMATEEPQLNAMIEESFFADPVARRKLGISDYVYVSFSALWGQQLQARVLRDTASTAWEHTPVEHEDVEFITVKGIQNVDAVCHYCVMQLGKDYDIASALFSVTGSECAWLSTPDKKFCSELCVLALQEDGILEDVKAASVTPNSLFQHITKWNLSVE